MVSDLSNKNQVLRSNSNSIMSPSHLKKIEAQKYGVGLIVGTGDGLSVEKFLNAFKIRNHIR